VLFRAATLTASAARPDLPQAQNARRCPNRTQRPRTGQNRREETARFQRSVSRVGNAGPPLYPIWTPTPS